MKTKRFFLSTTHILLLSFLVTILIGTLLLSMPISSADRTPVPVLDALFTATTSTCVTGLVTVPTFSTWSLFGQAVIFLLIQIGGLGVITVLSGLMILLHKKLGLGDRVLLQDSFNLNSLSGLVRFVKKVVRATFLVESVGAFLYMIVFIPEYGAKGIWISFFTSVSAFCNAGIDILGPNSLCDYGQNPVVLTVTSLLIVLGGLGYIVWWDVLRVFRQVKKKKLRAFRSLTLHSKIALTSTALLIVLGAGLIFAFEHNNPQTMEGLSLFKKIQASLFQSITTRTAGFATIPQENLSNPTSVLCLLLMFIGGSPVGTAGGIKTVTFAVLVAAALSTIQNKNETDLFGRQITKQAVGKALAVTMMSFSIAFVSTVLLSAATNADMLDVLYETVSATATVGLTRNLTASLGAIGKIILIPTMYFGRVGPISLALAFNQKNKHPNQIKNPVEEISVG